MALGTEILAALAALSEADKGNITKCWDAIGEVISGEMSSGVKIGWSSRDAGGDQVITGVGYQSSLIIFLAADTPYSNRNWSVGFDDGAVAMSVYNHENGTLTGVKIGESIAIDRLLANKLMGHVTAIGADGFTITWALTGAASLYFIYLAVKLPGG